MATKNDITGDPLVSKSPTEAYRDGWDLIFGKKFATSRIGPNQESSKKPDMYWYKNLLESAAKAAGIKLYWF